MKAWGLKVPRSHGEKVGKLGLEPRSQEFTSGKGRSGTADDTEKACHPLAGEHQDGGLLLPWQVLSGHTQWLAGSEGSSGSAVISEAEAAAGLSSSSAGADTGDTGPRFSTGSTRSARAGSKEPALPVSLGPGGAAHVVLEQDTEKGSLT